MEFVELLISKDCVLRPLAFSLGGFTDFISFTQLKRTFFPFTRIVISN